MNDWKQIKELVASALDVPPESRAEWVSTECPPALRSQVEELLRADEKAGSFLSDPTVAPEVLQPTPPIDEEIPRKLGRYPIETRLARGGSGIVYRGQDPKLGRPVALKVLTAGWDESSDEFADIVAEARSLARCSHPHIATLYALEETTEGERFLVLELVEGSTLSERIEEGGIGIETALSIAQQMARALGAAHRRGIIHRDLKPRNVMIDLEGSVKVIDFGIARAIEKSMPEVSHYVAGTPAYMSPEQLRGDALDPRSDIYSWGLLLHELLTGTPPQRNPKDGAISIGALRSVHETHHVPELLSRLVADCIEPDRNRRPASMEEILGRLSDLSSDSTRTLRIEESRPAPIRGAPRPLTGFVGRETELAELESRFGQTRLLSLTGPGGCGKSRLALRFVEQHATEFAEGATWIQLEATSDPEQVGRQLLVAMQLRESPGKTPERVIVEHLGDRSQLLILDGCEHLLEACTRLVEQVLLGCQNVKLVTTSQQRLGLNGEASYPVPSLSLPEETRSETYEEAEAVHLFAVRAREAKPGFRLTTDNAEEVVTICRQLDGIPLAIELAAARVRAMSPSQIAQRLQESPNLLSNRTSVLPRQRTMRAAYDWGFELLSPGEQRLFGRLSVFQGGWTLDAAESVCASAPIARDEVLELLTALIEKSLVVFEDTGEGRYRLLQTGRQYARDRLQAAGDEGEVQLRHRDYFLEFARQRNEERATDAGSAMDALQGEHENLLGAIGCSIRSAPPATPALLLCDGLVDFWNLRSRYGLARSILKQALALPESPEDLHLRGRLLEWAGRMASTEGDYQSAEAYFEEGLSVCREGGDTNGLAGTLISIGTLHLHQAEHAEARRKLEEGLELYQSVSSEEGMARGYGLLAVVAHREGAIETAQEHDEKALHYHRRVGDKQGVAATLNGLGHYAVHRGELEKARSIYEECLAVARELGFFQAIAATLVNLGTVARYMQDLPTSNRHFEESLSILRGSSGRRNLAITLAGLAPTCIREDRLREARVQLQECLDISRELGAKSVAAYALEATAQLAAKANEHEEALMLLGAAEALREAIAAPRNPTEDSDIDSSLESTRAALSPETRARAADAGRSLDFEQTVDRALRFLDSHPFDPA